MSRAAILLVATILLGGCERDAEPVLPEGFAVLAEASADLDGDGRDESVRLVGRGAADSPFREDLCLVVGPSAHLWPLPSAAAGGYGPQLQLVDVTGDGSPEIIVTADTGGSGGMVAAAVVTARPDGKAWTLHTVFDSESGPRPRFAGALVDGFAAEMEVTAPGLPRKQESLDLAARREIYLQTGVYDEHGTLQHKVEIWGDALMSLTPVAASAGGPGLQAVQQARGTSNADRLVEIRTLMVWKESQWQAVSLTLTPIN